MDNLDEEYDAYEEAYKYIKRALEELPKGKIKEQLEETAQKIKDKINELEGMIEERNAKDYDYEYKQRQREYREMQGF